MANGAPELLPLPPPPHVTPDSAIAVVTAAAATAAAAAAAAAAGDPPTSCFRCSLEGAKRAMICTSCDGPTSVVVDAAALSTSTSPRRQARLAPVREEQGSVGPAN